MNDPYRHRTIEFPATNDEKTLRLLAVFHYVVGALMALLSCFFVLYVVAGAVMLGSRAGAAGTSESARTMGLAVVIGGMVAVLIGWVMAAVTVYAGRCIAGRTHRQFCMVVAGLLCMWTPIGTVLGVFTLVLLTKPVIRTLFADTTVPVVAPSVHAQPDLVGWTSTEAKRRFVPRAVILGASLAAVQIVVPIFYFAFVFVHLVRAPHVTEDTEGAAPLGDKIWFIENAGQLGVTSKRLASIDVHDDAAPSPGPEIPDDSRILAADGSRLWIFGHETLELFDEGHITTYPFTKAPAWSTRPFLYDSRPALFDWHGSREIRMKRLEGDDWNAVPGESWVTSVRLPKLPTAWAVLPADDGFDVFMQFQEDLRWRHIVTGNSLEDPRDWERLPVQARWWAAAQVKGESVIIQSTEGAPWDRRLQIWRHTGTGWTKGNSFDASPWGSLAAWPLSHDGIRFVLSQPTGVATIDVAEGSVQSTHMHVQQAQALFGVVDSRWFATFLCLSFAPGILASALLSRWMRRDRVDLMAGNGSPMRFASPFQRGLAWSVDQGLGFIVLLPWGWRWLRSFFIQAMAPRETMTALGVSLAFWAAIGLVTAFTEGRWGMTPGKWIVGIRVVGIDGVACGFWRALLRNLFRVADSMLSFVVGMLAIAFATNWQRVGDMIAKTVVVQSGSRSR